MWMIFRGIWAAMKWLGACLVWPFTAWRESRRVRTVVRWTVHVLAVLVILGCLVYLNYLFQLDTLLAVPASALRYVWAPLLFLLAYALAWIAWALWRLLSSSAAVSPFPDLDDAWHKVLEALRRAGTDLTRTPLFLVLGRPAESEEGWIRAAGLTRDMLSLPRQPNAPLWASGNEKGIYVGCPGSSLLGRQAELLGRWKQTKRELAASSPCTKAATADDSLPAWSAAEADPAHHPEAFDRLQRTVALLTEEEVEAEPQTECAEPEPETKPQAAPRPSLLQDDEAIALCERRIRHLCGLVAESRDPFCPLNGVLLAVPLAATDDDRLANETAELIERDLESVQEVIRMEAPVVVVVCDLETAPGGAEFLQRFPVRQKDRRLGVPFPSLADCDRRRGPRAIEEGTRWICERLMPPLVYRLVDVAAAAGEDGAQSQRGHARLYRLLEEFRKREGRFRRLLIRSLYAAPDREAPWHPGGLFFAATGSDVASQQAFSAGVLPRLREMQNHVGWTEATLAEDARLRRWAALGYVGIVAVAGAVLGALWLI